MSGTLPALTPMPLHNCSWPPEKQAEQRKMAKYIELAATHHFVPVAIESMGVFGPQAHAFFHELSRRIKEETGEPLSLHYLHQRIAVAIQRGNAAAVLGTYFPTQRH